MICFSTNQTSPPYPSYPHEHKAQDFSIPISLRVRSHKTEAEPPSLRPSQTKKETMASASASLSPAMSTASTFSSRRQMNRVHYITGLNSFGGLKAHNHVLFLGVPSCPEQSFAKVVSSLKFPSKGRGGGGALSSTCNAVGEIFRIAAIINGLVLVGVAVGFVLLRIEAFVEESESDFS